MVPTSHNSYQGPHDITYLYFNDEERYIHTDKEFRLNLRFSPFISDTYSSHLM